MRIHIGTRRPLRVEATGHHGRARQQRENLPCLCLAASSTAVAAVASATAASATADMQFITCGMEGPPPPAPQASSCLRNCAPFQSGQKMRTRCPRRRSNYQGPVGSSRRKPIPNWRHAQNTSCYPNSLGTIASRFLTGSET